MRRFFLLSLAVLLYNMVCGQSSGDYRSRQSGRWSLNTTWEKYQGGTWISPSNDFPALTNIRTKITIRNTHTVSATGNLRSQASLAGLTVDQGGTLNMGTYYLRSSSATGSRFPSLVINGILSTSSYVSAVTITIGATGALITSYTGTTGWWATTFAPTTVSLNGTIQYTGGANQRVPAYQHYNIIVSGTGTKILNGNITVAGLATINSGSTFNTGGYTLTFTGAGILINGVLQTILGTLTFGGGTQNISGTGSFSGSFTGINIGTASQSNTTLSVTAPLVTNNLRIDRPIPNTGSSFTISSSSKLQVLTSLDIFINGGLVLESDASSTASLIAAATGLNGGTADANVELFLTGAPGGLMYHYISSPVTSAPATIFSSVNISDVSKYNESLITSDKANGWVAYDGWHYNSYTNTWENLGAAEAWSAMVPGSGYNYYYSSDRTILFQGRLNSASTNVSLFYNSAGDASDLNQQGFNLAGNPFTSGLDWDAVVAANNIWNDVGAAIYFTRNGTSYSYINGITVPDDLGDGRYIPAMQGFFVKSNLNNVTLTIPASAKSYTNHVRYKSATMLPMLRVQIVGAGKSDQVVIRFDKSATAGFDNRFDSRKAFPPAGYPYIAASMAEADLSVNGLPFPEDSTEIPLTFSAPSSGKYTISAKEISALRGYNIYLNDKLLSKTLDFGQAVSYEFSTEAGKFSGRFTLIFTKNKDLPVPEIINDKVAFITYTGSGYLNIRANTEGWDGVSGKITVYDLTGRAVVSAITGEFMSGENVQIPFNFPIGIYIVEIKSTDKRYAGKFLNRL